MMTGLQVWLINFVTFIQAENDILQICHWAKIEIWEDPSYNALACGCTEDEIHSLPGVHVGLALRLQ